MLAKLSFRNAKRSIKDYSIYILTVTIIFALLYSFQLLAFSEEIRGLAEAMNTFQTILIFVSCIIVFVVAWLVNYMNRFMLEKRGKELGTYMLLGISNRSITHMVLIENVIVGSIAFGLGIILGTFLYQIFLQIIMNVFELPYQIAFPFSWEALGMTGLYALLSYVFSMFRMKRKLKRIRICDLIYIKAQNDKKRKKLCNHWITNIIAVCLCVTGGYLFYITCVKLDSIKRACIGFCFFLILHWICLYMHCRNDISSSAVK
ncbi:MAG: ABC transporter permease [Clostridiales bacterium]|nr:ABC transporter permease [Clostridiales bacterium]